jgi:hypothetical protein
VRHRRLAQVLVAVGTLLTILAIFAVWAERQALNTNEWVDTSGKLLNDDKIDSALAEYMVNQLYTSVDVQSEIAAALPPRAAPLAAPIAGGLRQLAVQLAERGLQSPRFEAAWKNANRTAHLALIDLIDGNGDIAKANGDRITLDLQPLLQQVSDQAGLSGALAGKLSSAAGQLPPGAAAKLPPGAAAQLPAATGQLPADAGQLTVLRSDDVHLAIQIARAIKGLSIVFSLLALGAFGLAIYLAAGDRIPAIRWSGLGLITAGILVLAIRSIAGGALVDALVKNDSATDAGNAVWSIGTSLLVGIAITVIAFGVVFVIASWLGSEASSAKKARKFLAPTLRESPGLVYGGVGLAIFIYFLLAPTHGLRAALTALALLALAWFGVTALRHQAADEFPGA